jgi:hypothetical protein
VTRHQTSDASWILADVMQRYGFDELPAGGGRGQRRPDGQGLAVSIRRAEPGSEGRYVSSCARYCSTLSKKPPGTNSETCDLPTHASSAISSVSRTSGVPSSGVQAK